jgi:hypothetical protein
MIKIKDVSLKSLIESNRGIHLSAYIENNKEIEDLKEKLKEVIIDASLHLSKALPNIELHKFLEPIELLLNDTNTLKAFKGNIGIFRTQNSFKILSVPASVEDTCIVANSFHVKPILKSLQSDKSYLLLGVTDDSAKLYHSSMGRINLVSEITLSKYMNLDKVVSLWLLEEFNKNNLLKGIRLYIAGEKSLTQSLVKSIQYRPKFRRAIHPSFSKSDINIVVTKIKQLMKKESEKSFEKSINEYYWAEDNKMTHNNIFKISKAAVEGNIKKLIIADGVNIFGKLCKTTGDLSIHFDELDHEDDDILDDLAQTVLMSGGEIVIAESNKLPGIYPALAILEKEEEEEIPMLMNKTLEFQENIFYRRTV